ncbi:uncharacterized protein LOC119353513 [Triticum dicoccoides]|uniref:uncharacterized protein LOC119353513 n=1 Tax=Triticum dicoccoides TaxID=85692 RepID=UPI0018909065|nr:uncharacterized protein LOC119353513 [Triticum dicoccoides]
MALGNQGPSAAHGDPWTGKSTPAFQSHAAVGEEGRSLRGRRGGGAPAAGQEALRCGDEGQGWGREVEEDANNQMYPIAWAIVEVESYDSWYWFIGFLQKDLQINNNGEGWVFISDQQKGLIRAVNELVPHAEHRMCARHIYANWRKEHRDKVFQKMFWACAKSSDRSQFNYNRAKLAQNTVQGARDMMKTAPEHWCRAYFRIGSFCDSVENNMCESFNNAIMRSRFYPVVTAMEIIRKKVTVRIQQNRAKSQKWHGTICPNIFKKLKVNIERSARCQVLWNGKDGFEVQEGEHRRYTVNLENWTCSCRYWQLSGLPCCHAVSAIYTCSRDLDLYISPCYSIAEYDRIYDHVLQPVNGPEDWPISDKLRPLPPKKRTQKGRPQTKRRQEEGEKPRDPSKMSRAGTQVTCSSCGTQGHNKRKCANNNTAGNKEQANFTRAATRRKEKQARTEQAHVPSTQQSSAPGPSSKQAPRASKPANRMKKVSTS